MPREEDAAQQVRALQRPYSLVVFLFKLERGGIDAVAKASWPRTIGKNMAEVRIATAAEHFLAQHSVAGVSIDFDFRFIDRRPEARPPGTGVVLCIRAK
jgi:hypothetical protein